MPPKKIRVYELARELGLENRECLELCERLRIGVKSHSSSIEDAQADRVRRLADSEGLRRAVAPGESADHASSEAVARPEASHAASPPPAPVADLPADLTGDSAEAPAPARPRIVRSTERGPVGPPTTPPPREAIAPSPRVPQAPAPSVPAVGVQRSAPMPVSAPAVEPAPSPLAPQGHEPAAALAPQAQPASPSRPSREHDPAIRPTPAPPSAGAARPMSASGKPIPPPPGAGARRPPAPPGRGGPPSAGRGGPPGGGERPSGGARFATGVPRPSGGFGAGDAGRAGAAPARPGLGAGRGAPGRGGPGGAGGPGGPGGFAGRGRPGPHQRPRRKKRRRSLDELEPQSAPSYTPSDAPVPEGEIPVPRGATIQDLAPRLNRTTADLVRMLMMAGEMVTAAQSLSDEMVELLADELGAEVILIEPGEEGELELQALLGDEDDDEALFEPRPPIVTVMGHVDHGKTKLLDRIRSANVVAGEAGGITQHIGAYRATRGSQHVTFIDTPGHEAFTAMRSRGARATDVAILVVAADDGVMPQTVEALEHARAAEVPVIVAINKVDREDADPTRVRQQLSEHQLVPEEWGGETIMVEVSATEGTGVEALLDAVLLVSEVEGLGANPKAPARGVVLEAHLDAGRGPVATVLVKNGTLRVGEPVVAGAAWGRVRALLDESGSQVVEAGPSTPVQVLGLDAVPSAGDEFRVAPDDKTARVVGEARARRRRHAGLVPPSGLAGGTRLEDIFAHIQRGEVATLNLILKADVQGSLEALTESLRKLERDDVKLAFVLRGVGAITESDVNLAAVSNATIIGFNVRPDRKGRELAEAENVDVRLYEVIYQVLEEVEAAMLGMLKPTFEEVVTGDAEVREIFSVPRIGKVAGCYVRSGVITRGSKVRFLREGVVIWNGQIASLKRFKEDAREVQTGFECGIGLENFQDLKSGDVIETYEQREIAPT